MFDPDVFEAIPEDHRMEWIREAIDKLPYWEKRVIELLFWERLSVARIVDILREEAAKAPESRRITISPSTVETLARRAYARIEETVRKAVEVGKVSTEDLESSLVLRSLDVGGDGHYPRRILRKKGRPRTVNPDVGLPN